ncbi:MAG: hypothetical protein WBN10_01245 [Polyangiales bacterium]
MKRTSYPRAVSRSLKVAAVVSISMAGLLFAAMQQAKTLRATRLLHQLPSTARAILRIDVASLEGTPAGTTLLAAFVGAEQLSEIEAVCALDPIEALSEVVVWIRGPDDQPLQSIGVMLRGRAAGAATLAACHRALVEGRGGTVVRLDGPSGPILANRDRQSAIAVLDDRTIVAGSVTTVTEAIGVWRHTAPALVERRPIASRWPLLSRRSSISALLEPPNHWMSALERVAKRLDGPSALEGAKTIGLFVESGSAAAVTVSIDVSSAELAAKDAARIRDWIASPPEHLEQPWTSVLQTARVSAHERTIEVTVDVSSLSTPP